MMAFRAKAGLAPAEDVEALIHYYASQQ